MKKKTRLLRWFCDNSEKFSDLCSGIQAIMMCIAIIVGGCWVYFQYSVLQQKRVADIDLDIKEKEIKGQIALEVSIVAKQITKDENEMYIERGDGDTEYRYINTVVTLKNNGTRVPYTLLSDNPLYVTYTSYLKNGVRAAKKNYRTEYTYWKDFEKDELIVTKKGGIEKIFIPINSSIKLSYLTRVDDAGIYQIHFEVPTDSDMLEEILLKGNDNDKDTDDGKYVYAADTFILVE